MMDDTMMRLIVIFAVVIASAIIVLVLDERRKRRIEEEILQGVYGGGFIPVDEFEENWIVGGGRGRSGFAGYKYEDGPGCYVILVFSHEVEDGGWGSFDDVYVGQSVNMCARVHAHFNGKGNGDVYADVRNGKHAYVQLKPCDRAEMNDLEKSLIAAFHATCSYNKTQGGSTQR